MRVRELGALGAYLREQRRNAELSVRQLADLAGVSNPYLSQIERGLRKPSAEVLQQLARSLRISAEALYVRAGLLDPTDEREPDTHTVEAAIIADGALNDRQRRVLLDIYESFRRETLEQRAHTDSAGPTGEPDTDEPDTDEPGSAGSAVDQPEPTAVRAEEYALAETTTTRARVTAPENGEPE